MSNASPLAVFREADISKIGSNMADIEYESRLTGKAIVINDMDEIALVGTSANPFLLLPGGGIGKGESLEKGVIREVLEETGCQVLLIKNIGFVEDYRTRDKIHCITYCYTAKVQVNKKKQSLTQSEKKNCMYVTWMPIGQAIRKLEAQVLQVRSGNVAFYNTSFNILRDSLFVKIANKYNE